MTIGHDVPVTSQMHERIARVGPRWFTTAFWVILLASIYRFAFRTDWEWWLVLGVLGGGATYCWWRVRRPQKWGKLWALSCGLIGVAALIAAAWALFTPFAVATESVGNYRVECGSVVHPISDNELRETDGETGELVVREQPISQGRLERLCMNRVNYRTSNAVGAVVIGLLFSVRAAGHAVRRHDTV
ncbi:hypothetical protein CH253_04380 [Rhodococcus sp. 06-156-3C]|nr:hypothetical protein CH280_08360 [Rhodococcus sp. 06-156-4C]OZD21378.1 hypothetical protein CH248_09665 [Rhodococcus sp. 06-156-4a]OZD24075.1 hypothetical protein CH247_29345 [Rhodococcus sp. 06-156-3b]OZD25248.1 hypothetical protein CH253_04380 [Rhodococcus sp. 06-156-3C]OZD40192.1 hypothetical protein CH284_04105 [Rhodococcus sp. 06-156-3]OZF66705.1 hypothetical protein CH290_07990 [Rhodococcus sp. 06-156-4]